MSNRFFKPAIFLMLLVVLLSACNLPSGAKPTSPAPVANTPLVEQLTQPAGVPICTPPPCAANETPLCLSGNCPGGCGAICVTPNAQPQPVCTPPVCESTDYLTCPSGNCPGGCGVVCSPPGTNPTPAQPQPCCTAPACGPGEVYACPSGNCPCGCGTVCQAPSTFDGFMAYSSSLYVFQDYNFSGAAGSIRYAPHVPASMGPGQFQVVRQTTYYYSNSDQLVHVIDLSGDRVVSFIPAGEGTRFAISRDGRQIAWNHVEYSTTINSTLYLANIDGTNAREVISLPNGGSDGFHVMEPVGWTSDGKLLYQQAATGLGGYILFWGMSSLYLYDPAANSFRSLVDVTEGRTLGVAGIYPDQSRAILGGGEISVRNLADGSTTGIPVLPDQGQSGSIRFSPSGTWMAYAIARGEMERERGQVVIIPANLGAAPVAITAVDNAWYNVEDWIDENRLLVSRFDASSAPSIWIVNRDGSGLVRLTDGYYAGLVNTAPGP